MLTSNRKAFEEMLTKVAAATWHGADHSKWMSSIIAVLTIYAVQARQNTQRGKRAAEKIVWTVFQCVSNPAETQKDAQEHLDFYADRTQPAHLVGAPTPEQEGLDAAQMNAFAKQLIVLFGVQKALHDALLRMQADADNPFYTHEYWAVGRQWVEAQFFAEVLPSETPAS